MHNPRYDNTSKSFKNAIVKNQITRADYHSSRCRCRRRSTASCAVPGSAGACSLSEGLHTLTRGTSEQSLLHTYLPRHGMAEGSTWSAASRTWAQTCSRGKKKARQDKKPNKKQRRGGGCKLSLLLNSRYHFFFHTCSASSGMTPTSGRIHGCDSSIYSLWLRVLSRVPRFAWTCERSRDGLHFDAPAGSRLVRGRVRVRVCVCMSAYVCVCTLSDAWRSDEKIAAIQTSILDIFPVLEE